MLVYTYIPLPLHNKTELVELFPINLQFDSLFAKPNVVIVDPSCQLLSHEMFIPEDC